MSKPFSVQSVLETLQSGQLAPKPHQKMYLSVYQRAQRVGGLLQTSTETIPPQKETKFRRHSSKTEKKAKPRAKILGFGKKKAHSEVLGDFVLPDPGGLLQEEEEQEERAVKFNLEVAAITFHQAVTGLETFVTTFAKTDRFVFHLASMRRMFLDLEASGIKLDHVLKHAHLTEKVEMDPQWGDGEWTWQKQLQADRDAEETELSAKAAKNALPFARNM
ncbi:hypothetical protein BBO99_00009471, partial [Phytophthora kernoviae]